MAVKYDRRRLDEMPRARHLAAAAPGGVRLSARHRLAVVYGGIAAFLLLLLALHGVRDGVFGPATRDGLGTVTAKSVDHLLRAEATYVVDIEIELGPGVVRAEQFATGFEHWTQLNAGDSVRVIYNVDSQGNYIGLRHVGVFDGPQPAP